MLTSTTKVVASCPSRVNRLIRRCSAGHGASGCLLFLVLGFVLLWAHQAVASSDGVQKPRDYGYFDFPTCVSYALVHSDSFVRNRLDIQIRSADVKDAHAELFPTIQLLTRYYFNRAGQNTTDDPNWAPPKNRFNVQVFMQNWNPFLALIKIQSGGVLVDIAKISHLDRISEDVANMAKLFHRVQTLEKSIQASKQLVALHRNKVSYGKNKDEQGTVDPIGLQVWMTTLRAQELKVKDLERELQEKTGSLKILMSYNPDMGLPLDTRDAANQILTGFNGRFVTFADIQGGNLRLKIMAKREQVQSQRVLGSYVALLPRPVLVFEQIQNEVDRSSGMNFAMGLDYTIWDGFARVRDIKRQKMVARQLNIDRRQYSERLYVTFRQLKATLDVSGEREALVREQAKLSELSEERAFLQYKSGAIGYDYYMDRRIDTVQAQLNALAVVQERVAALIDLATMAGGLTKYNASIRY